jgi:hypothetical protein
MANLERTESVCTLSWINGKTGLPENDGAGPLSSFLGALVTREDDALPFRFVNLLEAKVVVTDDSPPRIVSAGWTAASKIYKNPSFGKIASEAFTPTQSITQMWDRVVFEQTVGARTVSPEVIGQAVGTGGPLVYPPPLWPLIPITRRLGRAVAHALSGFPPIWTVIQMTVFADGHSEAKVLRNSLFPSMNFYTRAAADFGKPRISTNYNLAGSSYDAVLALDRWKTDGWGTLAAGASGPSPGNPWNYSKSDLTIRDEAERQTAIV